MNFVTLQKEISELEGFIKGLELSLDFGYTHIGPCSYQDIDKSIVDKIEKEIVVSQEKLQVKKQKLAELHNIAKN